MKYLCEDVKRLHSTLQDANDKISSTCEVCIKNGRSGTIWKTSINHTDEAFNEELQMDSFLAELKRSRHTITKMKDTRAEFFEVNITIDQKMESITTMFANFEYA